MAPRIRVLYSWEGNGRPYLPGTIVDVDDAVVRDRVSAGHAELVDAKTPLTVASRPASARSGDQDDTTPPANTTDDRDAAVAEVRNLRVPELAKRVTEIEDRDLLQAILDAENADPRPRNGAQQALEARLAELAPAPGDGSDAADDDTSGAAEDDASSLFLLRQGDEFVVAYDDEGHRLGAVDDAVQFDNLDEATALAERLGEGVLVVEVEVEDAAEGDDDTDDDDTDDDASDDDGE